MFQSQPQQQPPPPSQQFAHRKPIIPSTIASQNEAQAKEKLAGYVYEYLIHSGASKAADAFKSEVLATTNIPMNILPGDAPGFLVNWWSVFWDLYASAPERRDKMDSSVEAKAFHEFGFIPPSIFNPGNVNGVLPNPQFGNGGVPPMSVPSADLPNYFRNNPSQASAANQSSPIAGAARYGGANAAAGTRSGAPTPSNVMGGGGAANGPPPNFPPGATQAAIVYNEQMRIAQAQAAQRMNANGPRMPLGNFNQAGAIRQMRPGTFPGGFIDSPTGAPAGFAPNPAMMPNGMMPGLIASPGSQPNGGSGPMGSAVPPPTTNPDGTPQHDPRFMMMGGNMAGQFAMGGHHDGAGTPTSCPSGGPPFGNAMGGMHGGPTDGNPSGNVSSLHSILNGGNANASAGGGTDMEMKHESPGSHMNNGTPGGGGMAQMNPGSIQGGSGPGPSAGPASVHGCHGDPGSVHSQQGGGVVSGGGPNSQQTYQTPTSEAAQSSMDYQHSAPSGNHGCDEEQEISKIKKNLIEGFESSTFS